MFLSYKLIIIVMSQISKARQRIMLSKRAVQSEMDERESIHSRQPPRKFTVSSFNNQFESKVTEMEFTPVSYNRQNNREIEQSVLEERTSRTFQNQAKENTPLMLKTINIKINDISKMENHSTPKYQESHREESQYFQSPPKITHSRLLHREKMGVLVAAPQIRRHHSPYKPAECSLEYTQSFINEQRLSGKAFVDLLFPPQRTIIFNKKVLSQQQGLKFQRLSRIYHNDITIVDNCEPTYISMGKYTNPYLYSALAILAEDPARILQLFGEQQANEDGIYSVNLCRDGVWRYVIVDDFVPVKSSMGRKHLFFLRSKEVNGSIEIWPALIEKAIAKTYGTYLDLASMQGEGMSDIFRVLTGAPSHQFNLNKDFRSYLILIDAALKRKHIVTLQMIGEEHQETAQLKKLNINQAYRVLQIKKSGLRMRNYSQPDLVTKLPFDQCLLFSRLVIYRLQPSYRYITHKLRHNKHFYSKLKITVPSRTRGYFEVWQNNPAYYKKYIGSHIDYQLARVKIWVGMAEEGEGEGEWLQSGKETELQEGEHEMHIHLCQQKVYDFTLSYYGEKEISLQRVKNMQEWYEACLCISSNK